MVYAFVSLASGKVCKPQDLIIYNGIEGSAGAATDEATAAVGLEGVLVLASSLLISFSSLSIPDGPVTTVKPRAPCLSNRYVSKFFLSSARPSRRAKRWVSSRKTSCAAMMEAAADSLTIRDDLSFSDC